jgi:hypothetical protein
VISSGTVQGYRNDSTWARGQAWALHGFTQAYAYTGDDRMLTTARSAADYFIGHLPADGVPYYDFQAPATDRPRDSSAAAIAASGLLWLARIEPDGCAHTFLDAAKRILTSLSAAPYLSQGTAGAASILLHATAQHQQGDVDNGLVYADYYFLEALLRYRDIASGATPLSDGDGVHREAQRLPRLRQSRDQARGRRLRQRRQPPRAPAHPGHADLGHIGRVERAHGAEGERRLRDDLLDRGALALGPGHAADPRQVRRRAIGDQLAGSADRAAADVDDRPHVARRPAVGHWRALARPPA